MHNQPDSTEVDGIGKLLESARTNKGWTRVQLSEVSSIPAISIAKYEKAGSPTGQYPPIKKLAKLALALELDANVVLASCFDTDEEIERWWQLQKDEGATVLGKILKEAFTSNKDQTRQIAEFLAQAANEKPEEASLATSSSGSNPHQPPHHNKEPDDG